MGDDNHANGRKKTFEIKDDERLIGFEADHDVQGMLRGLTFVKLSV